MTAPSQFLDVLVPPPGLVGHSAVWVSPQSTAPFLDVMMTRFTGLRAQERSRLGTIVTFCLHDTKANETRPGVFGCDAIPALYDMPPVADDDASPMRARLLLMVFSHTRTGAPAHVRLVVFTGDLTQAAAQAGLTLAWCVDVTLGKKNDAADCADVAAAAAFVKALVDARYYRPDGALKPKSRTLTARLDTLLSCCMKVGTASRAKRFVCTLHKPLLAQGDKLLRARVRGRCNLVVCASPTYNADAGEAPHVLQWLSERKVLHPKVRKAAVLPTAQVQALESWAAAQAGGWELHIAADARHLQRTLSANYLFLGQSTAAGAKQGLLVVTSTDLEDAVQTTQVACGFMLPMKSTDVATFSHGLFWDPGAAPVEAGALTLQQPTAAEAAPLAPVAAAPILLAQAAVREGNIVLRPAWRKDLPKTASVSIAWKGQDWTPIVRKQELLVADGTIPSMVEVRDEQSGTTWVVPGVNLKGRVCLQEEPSETFAEALDLLLDFPPQLGDTPDEEEDEEAVAEKQPPVRTRGEPKVHALQAAAEFLEKVAHVQSQLDPATLDDWLDHLDRVLSHALPVPLKEAWRTHNFDFVTPMSAPSLAPGNMTPKQKQRYVSILKSVLTWGEP